LPVELWWVFPASVLFSTIAISSGVSGALFFSPFFMLVVGLSPAQAIGAGLLTEVFGMGNGLRLYVRQRAVDFATARWILAASVPTAGLGALVAHRMPGELLKLLFGLGLLGLAGALVANPARRGAAGGEAAAGASDAPGRTLRTRDGQTYHLGACSRGSTAALSALGGFLTGLISAGLPELNTTQLVVRCRVPPRIAVATSVFTLAITALVGAGVHALAAQPAWHVVRWSVPGVLCGSFLGSRLSRVLPAEAMEMWLGIVFAAVGTLVLAVQWMHRG